MDDPTTAGDASASMRTEGAGIAAGTGAGSAAAEAGLQKKIDKSASAFGPAGQAREKALTATRRLGRRRAQWVMFL